MTSIHEILQFNFSPSSFKQSAEKIIPKPLNLLNDHRVDKLNKLTEEVGISSFIFNGNNLIPQIVRKFKKSISYETNFDRKELRTLTYSFNHTEYNIPEIFQIQSELSSALDLLDSNWRDSFLLGLIDCLLRNWETKHKESLLLLENFINNKIDNYTGNRTALISFKSNKKYFNIKNGALVLGDTIARLNRPIQEATKILGVPESWINYTYFSKVIVTYYERNKTKIIDEIDNLNDILQKHNNSITNKRLISKIIIQVKGAEFLSIQDKVKKIAFTYVGDPSSISEWNSFENATETEKNELSEARDILNEWITQQFINVFFKVCISDERRKKFWLKFSSKISTFKVYGSLDTKKELKSDERISEYVDARFETVSRKNSISAFILYIGNYMLIEFSEKGYAFLAYRINSPYKPDLNKQLNSVDDLRNGSMPMAVERVNNSYNYKDEGRLYHGDASQFWEAKFNDWLIKKVL